MEFNQPQEDDSRHREGRVPSISYSTFVSEPRINSVCKPALDSKPISFTEGPYVHSNSQNQFHPSVIPACTLANTNELDGSLSAGIHPPFGTESVTQTNTYSSKNYTYDTPKRLASQPLEAIPVWRSFTDHQLDNGHKMKPIAVPPCVIPVTQDVENKSVPLHNHAASTKTETTYDIPRKTSQNMPLYVRDKHPNYSTGSNECDSSGAMPLKLASVVTSERTQPLSEMIKSHPLLKRQPVHVDRASLQSTCKCGNSSSSPCSCRKVAYATPLKNDPISSQGGEAHDNKGYSSTTLLESSTSTKQSDTNPCQGQATEYSHVISASMNRAQTLIARNIQELKRLDCQQVNFKCINVHASLLIDAY